eukprot:3449667-Amphidinium_carterae.1
MEWYMGKLNPATDKANLRHLRQGTLEMTLTRLMGVESPGRYPRRKQRARRSKPGSAQFTNEEDWPEHLGLSSLYAQEDKTTS